MLRRGGEKIFSALLKINVLIFLRYGVVRFLIFTHDAFRSFLRCLCHIEVCVAVQRLALHFAINLARVGWSVIELQIFFLFFPLNCFKSKAHTFVVKRCRRRNNINVRCIMSSKTGLIMKRNVLKWF